MQQHVKLLPNKRKVVSADGNSLGPIGEVHVKLKLGKVEFNDIFIILNNLQQDIILSLLWQSNYRIGCTWNRECKHFLTITLPITSLLKKNTPFVWSDKYQLALEYLKEIFCNKPLLQFLDPNKPCTLYTDASNNAYSGSLCQLVDNDQDIRPAAYFSGTFTAQNRNWCATEKEVYAILKSMQCFDTISEV